MLDEIAKMMEGDSKRVDKNFQVGFSGSEIESVVVQVMENAYVEYQKALDEKKEPQRPIKISKEAFEKVIKEMKDTIMANQLTSKEEKSKNPNKTTNIERIQEMEKTYNFKRATK